MYKQDLCKDGALFLGVNYWSSRDAIKMWENWDIDVIEQDFKILREYGITHVRVFPLWSFFQPIHALNANDYTVEYSFASEPLPNTEAGRAGVSETACERFEELCSVAEKYGLKIIVGLITGHMSFRYFAPPALEGKNLVSDPTAIKWELRFVKYFVRRMSAQPSIVGWDLGNECNGFGKGNSLDNPDRAYLWCSSISDAIRSCDPTRPVITGFDTVPVENEAFNIFDISEIADIHTVHTYNIFQTKIDPLVSMRPILYSSALCKMYSDIGKLPVFLQETGSIGYTNCSKNSEAMFFRALALSSFVYNCFGVMWWCAFDQGCMDYPPYDWNTIGSDYGLFTYDRKPKPLAFEYKKLAEWFEKGTPELLSKPENDAVCILSRNVAFPAALANTTFCLALQANLNISFAHATSELCDLPIYIFPSIDRNHSIHKRHLDKLLKKVENGACLYLSIGEGLFRGLPELTGMTIAYREKVTKPEVITMGKTKLTLKADYKFAVEACDAEVLATGEDGRPVYVKHKYGNGYIYFSTVPIEKCLIENSKAFNSNNGDNYSVWYKPLYDLVKSNHAVNIDSKVLRVTEHPINENSRTVVAINYSYDEINAALDVKQGWKVSEVSYGKCNGKEITVPPCDAVILTLTK